MRLLGRQICAKIKELGKGRADMVKRTVFVLLALLIGSNIAVSAELYVPTKGGTKIGQHPTIRMVEKSYRPSKHGASSCTLMPLCLLFGAQASNR